MPPPKVAPRAVAGAIVSALKRGLEDVFVGDPVVATKWKVATLQNWLAHPAQSLTFHVDRGKLRRHRLFEPIAREYLAWSHLANWTRMRSP